MDSDAFMFDETHPSEASQEVHAIRDQISVSTPPQKRDAIQKSSNVFTYMCECSKAEGQPLSEVTFNLTSIHVNTFSHECVCRKVDNEASLPFGTQAYR